MAEKEKSPLKEGQVEVTVWVNRTVQVRQYEPYVLGMSGKLIVPEEDAETAYDDLFDLIDGKIQQNFEELGLVK